MDRNNNNHQVPLANPHGSSSNNATSSFLVAAIADQQQPSEVVDDQQQQEASVKQNGNALLGIVVPLSCTNNHKGPLILRQQVDHPYYQDEKLPPCQLSSSIYYGGQDIIPHSMNMKKSYTPNYSYSVVNQGVSGALKNDVDSEEFANRGDWWKGSFYY